MAELQGRADLLLAMMDDAYDGSDWHGIKGALREVTREELHYTPVPTASEADRSSGESSVISIAGRVVHVALCKAMYENHAFGDRGLTWEAAAPAIGLTYPVVEPAPLIDALDAAQQRLKSALARLSDEDLDGDVFTNWGEQIPAWRIFNIMIQHDIWHGGQIRTLRHLYQLKQERSERSGT